jgi:putative DNA primase/helicase
MSIDFAAITKAALGRAPSILSEWMPDGRLGGKEFRAGTVNGKPGRSFSVNIQTGEWADFATGEKGGDLVSLRAAMDGSSQGGRRAQGGRTLWPQRVAQWSRSQG